MPTGAYRLSDDYGIEIESGKLFGPKKISLLYGRQKRSSFISYKEEEGFTYELQGQRVKQIAHDSTMLSDEGILKIYRMSSHPEKKMHVLYYEHFDQFLPKDWFKNHLDGMKDQHGNLTASVRDSIRNVMVTVKKVWENKLFLKGLGDLKSFVTVGGKIKIINIMSSTEDLVDPEEWKNGEEIELLDDSRFKALIKKEIGNIKILWKTLLESDDAWPERDYFLRLFDLNIDPWEVHMDKIITHPFLKDSEGRIKCFSEIHHLHVTASIPREHVFYPAIRTDFVEHKNTLNGVNAVEMSPLLKALFTTDSKGNPTRYGNTVLELLRFLRNAYEHRPITFPVCDLDREIRKLWPGFLEKLHEKL